MFDIGLSVCILPVIVCMPLARFPICFLLIRSWSFTFPCNLMCFTLKQLQQPDSDLEAVGLEAHTFPSVSPQSPAGWSQVCSPVGRAGRVRRQAVLEPAETTVSSRVGPHPEAPASLPPPSGSSCLTRRPVEHGRSGPTGSVYPG